jgi:general secretion pathway protein H
MKDRTPPADSGFTLLELIVVMFLISLMAGISVVLFTGTLTSGKLDATARSLVAAMKHARVMAAVNGEPQAVFIDLDTNTYGIEGKDGKPFPKGITVTVADPLQGRQTGGRSLITFDPLGSIQGEQVILSTPKRSLTVRPDPLVAAVAVSTEKSP